MESKNPLRLRNLAWLFAACAVLAAAAGSMNAFFPITVNNVRVLWDPADQPVTFVINDQGSEDVGDAADDLAFRRSFDAWENLGTSSIAFTEITDPAEQARTDVFSLDIHLMIFDETDQFGIFPGDSGIIAVTPLLFDTVSGFIVDADIIFNGDDHTFSTNKTAGTFDIQAVMTHEVGHFIGLDHSGCGSATMFPFANTARTAQRSLDGDDIAGATEIYPNGGLTGSISGTVQRATTSAPVPGAHVVAMDSNGIVACSTYSDSSGDFSIDRLANGTYTVFAEPLDLPVSGLNLSSSVGAIAETNFQTSYFGDNAAPTDVVVSGGGNTAIGALEVDAVGTRNLTTSTDFPVLATRGGFATLVIGGSGLKNTDDITFTGDGITIFLSTFAGGASPTFTLVLQVNAAATLGPRNLELTDPVGGTAFAVLTGVIEVVDAEPTVTVVAPGQGDSAGGDTITLTGTGFIDGANVIFGDALATNVNVLSPTSLTCTSPAGTGEKIVMVENPDGQLFVDPTVKFEYFAAPVIDFVYPSAGTELGGSTVFVNGDKFQAGATVTFGGVSATVNNVTDTRIECVVPAGTAGAVDVEVTNPSGPLTTTAIQAFDYLAVADPTIATVDPAQAPSNSGARVTVTGTGFEAGATAFLGRSQFGTGGIEALDVTVVDATTVRFTLPSSTVGIVSVQVVNPSGSVAFASGAFTYQAATPAPSGGGGGGGCFAVVPPPGGFTGGGMAGGMLPWGVLFAVLIALRLRRREDESLQS